MAPMRTHADHNWSIVRPYKFRRRTTVGQSVPRPKVKIVEPEMSWTLSAHFYLGKVNECVQDVSPSRPSVLREGEFNVQRWSESSDGAPSSGQWMFFSDMGA